MGSGAAKQQAGQSKAPLKSNENVNDNSQQNSHGEVASKKSTVIPDAAERAITLRQLKAVYAEIEKRCVKEQWVSTGGPSAGQPLKPEEVNLYDAMKYFILPATGDEQCSYVELVAKGPQKPLYFVSHWWGEPVRDFVLCLEQHAEDHKLDEDTAYWVCAYANNQYNLLHDVSADPSQSAFHAAIQQSKGTVSIVDKQGIVFSRVWCVYEIWLSSTIANYTFECYTAHHHEIWGSKREAVGLVEGCAFHNNKVHNIHNQKHGDREFPGYKTQREAHFPKDLLNKCVQLSLETAQATVEQDRRSILNTIAGRKGNELTKDPPADHDGYVKVNRLVRGKFANQTLMAGLKSAPEERARYMDALKYSPMTSLFVDVPGDLAEEAQLQLVDSLPPVLESMVMRGCSVMSEGLGKLPNLKSLNLSQSGKLTSLPESIGELQKLEFVCLAGCTTLKKLPLSILNCKSLKKIELCAITEIPDFEKGLPQCQVIRKER
eukprot:TRINITY_DN14724_c0_g1_i1.p1 TRINITY_DN14724_c0_g1~~TRINITY_DN14724_c0_g1_i1.p1  ORF type:complete len:502 (+),score=101.79 TRINITY_DN14724_c0_g1_i1:37-1506(+)